MKTVRDEVREAVAELWDEAHDYFSYLRDDADDILDTYTDRIIKIFVEWTREAGIG